MTREQIEHLKEVEVENCNFYNNGTCKMTNTVPCLGQPCIVKTLK